MDRWGAWNPAAGFFHAATRNVEMVGLDEIVPYLRAKVAREPMPFPRWSLCT